MRVLILSQYFWPENFRINELALALNNKGLDVKVLTGKPNYPAGSIFSGYRAWGGHIEHLEGVQVYRVPLMPRGKGTIRLGLNYLSFILSALLFGPWLLRGQSFDAIFVFAPSPIFQAIPAIWLGWLKRCPVLLWVQDLWPESLSATGYINCPRVLKAIEYIVRMIYQKVDLLLVQSYAFISRVQPLAGTTPIVYYPNSFLEDKPSSVCPLVKCPGFDCDFPVLFTGNLGTAQAIHVVLEAATLLRGFDEVRFIMVGDGSQREWIMQEAAARGLTNIIFPGPFPIAAMPALMGKAEALLVTLADAEILSLTIPSKVQAYLAAGRPIIACLNGVGADIVMEAGAGVAVPAEDASALAGAISELLDLPKLERSAMGERGRRYFEEHFSHKKLVDELIGHLDRIIRCQQGRTL